MYTYRKLSPEEQHEIVESRIKSGVPAHQPPHPEKAAKYYLLSASCYEHHAIISTPERRALLISEFANYANEGTIGLIAWVFLPNHYHMLAQVNDFNELGAIFKTVHGRTSYLWNKEDSAKGRKVWYNFADRYIRNEAHFFTTLNYIHFNPVKHGYVVSPYAWECSSVHWYKRDKGDDWLRDLWVSYPLHEYGKNWDDI